MRAKGLVVPAATMEELQVEAETDRELRTFRVDNVT